MHPHGLGDLRLPIQAQQAYERALDSGFFERFVLCGTFDTDGEQAVLSASYYLFGVVAFTILDPAHFFLEQWDG